MAIPSKQIGWSNEANLLWYIAKELEQIKGQLNRLSPITPSTTTTTTTVAPTQFNLQSATSGANACNANFAGVVTLYSASPTVGPGVSVFTNIELTNPFTEGYALYLGGIGGVVVAGPNGLLSTYTC